MLVRTSLAPVLWGTTFLVSTEFLPVSPLWNALLRALPAGLVLLALRPGRPRGDWWWRALVLGALHIGVFFTLVFVAAQRLPGGVAGTLNSVQTVLVLGLAAVVLAEPVRASQVLAAVGGVAGVALLVLNGEAALDAVGLLAALGGAVSASLGIVLSRKWGLPEGVSGLTLTAWQLLGGAVALLPVALLLEGAPPVPDGRALLGLLWLSLVATAFAHTLFFAGLRRLPAGRVALLGLLNPLTATLLGWVVLDQRLTGWQLLGAALVLGSVVLGQARTSSQTRWWSEVSFRRASGERAVGQNTPVASGNSGREGST
ncbi:putative blue pigment (indigoidine) exporter [Crossiella equi]|uniref:Blue pigment (Indigoidine) exporter n=1 Tax=Crossiella equi TaxID=130796 RepID=A0ABS5AI37_9PSEU|nr:putative blue pigment (indigoidine) exporter [Crossiella equi]